MAKQAKQAELTGKPKMAKLNAWVADELRLRLYHALLDNGLDFSKWLRQQIENYLCDKGRSGSAKRGR